MRRLVIPGSLFQGEWPLPKNNVLIESFEYQIGNKYIFKFSFLPQKNKEETDYKTSANQNKEEIEPLQEQRKAHEHKSYADTVRSQVHQNNTIHQPDSYKVIEQMFIKQSQKIDTVLQQMSTLLELITVLVSKLTK